MSSTSVQGCAVRGTLHAELSALNPFYVNRPGTLALGLCEFEFSFKPSRSRRPPFLIHHKCQATVAYNLEGSGSFRLPQQYVEAYSQEVSGNHGNSAQKARCLSTGALVFPECYVITGQTSAEGSGPFLGNR